MREFNFSEFLNHCGPAIADDLMVLSRDPGTDYLVLFENVNPSSPHYGAKTVIAVGEGWSYCDPEVYRGTVHDAGDDNLQACLGLVYVGPREPDYADPLWMFDTVAEMRRQLHGCLPRHAPRVAQQLAA